MKKLLKPCSSKRKVSQRVEVADLLRYIGRGTTHSARVLARRYNVPLSAMTAVLQTMLDDRLLMSDKKTTPRTLWVHRPGFVAEQIAGPHVITIEKYGQTSHVSMTATMTVDERLAWATRLQDLFVGRDIPASVAEWIVSLKGIEHQNPLVRMNVVPWLECIESYMQGRWPGVSR